MLSGAPSCIACSADACARSHGVYWALCTLHLLQCTASLSRGSAQWNSYYAPPHCLGAVGGGTPAMHCLTAWGQWAVGSATPAMHCHTALVRPGPPRPPPVQDSSLGQRCSL